VGLVVVTGLLSMVCVHLSTPWQLYSYALGSWFYFAAGVLCFWCGRGVCPLWTLGIYLIAMTISALWSLTRQASFILASFEGIEMGVILTLLLLVSKNRNWLQTISLGRAGQWLGLISYSLYLTHGPVLELCRWSSQEIWGAPSQALWWMFGTGLPLSLVAAWAFYQMVERPTMQWAARLKKAWQPRKT